MRWEESVGFLALGLNVVGNLMLTSKHIGGWWVRLACNGAQLAYAALIWSPSLGANALTFAGINLVGLARWKRSEGHADGCGTARGWFRGRPCTCGRLS